MKNVKFGLFALATIAGVGGAFAGSGKKFAGATYFAVSTGGGHFFWTKTDPTLLGKTCQTPNAIPFCTVVTRGGASPYAPQTNIVPTASQATPLEASHSVYR